MPQGGCELAKADDYLLRRNVSAVLKVPGVRVVAVRAAKQTTRNEQNDTQARSVVARRGFIGMEIAMCAVGVFLNCVLIRSIRREANMQIVAAARLDMAELGHRLSAFR